MNTAEHAAALPRSLPRHAAEWAAFATVVVVILLTHLETLSGMVRTWMGNGAYAHGWIVPALAAALVWQRRETLEGVAWRPHWSGVLAIAVLAWIVALAQSSSIQFVAQLGLVAMVPAAALACFGPSVLRVLAAPAAFLLFMVPFGDELVPWLTRLTAVTTVAGVQLAGVPVYQDGLYFSIPSGDFEVAKACSGLRYLIASLTLSFFYALMFLRDRRLQLTFVALGIVVPVLANLVRAFAIVMLAHWSDMRIATGVDHIIYGWIFFGVVMLALFAMGERLRRRDSHVLEPRPAPAEPHGGARSGLSLAAYAAASLIVTGLAYVAASPSAATMARPAFAGELAEEIGEWRAEPGADSWQPRYPGATRTLARTYRSAVDGSAVRVALVLYAGQSQGRELVNWDNAAYDSAQWRGVSESRRTVVLSPGKNLVTTEVQLRAIGGSQSRLLWRWYVVGALESASESRVQLERLRLRALRDHPSEGAVLVSTSNDAYDGGSAILERFLTAAHGELRKCFEP